MKEATEILIKMKRSGELFLADERTICLLGNANTEEIFFQGFEEKKPVCKANGFVFVINPLQLGSSEVCRPGRTVHALFYAEPNPNGTGRLFNFKPGIELKPSSLVPPVSIAVFEPIEILGRPVRELPFVENPTVRRQESVLTAVLMGVEKAVQPLLDRPAPAAILLTEQGGVICITRQGRDELFEDLETALSEQMIYPEELKVSRIARNPQHPRNDFFKWAADNWQRAPHSARPFLRYPSKGVFAIPSEDVDKLRHFAQQGPEFFRSGEGPAFIFLPEN